jgi:hypothetical protein
MPRRTALIVAVPEAEPHVAELRLAHDSSARLGVPAHITILFPFLDGADVDEYALADLLAGFACFDFALAELDRFPDGPVWLRPEPSGPFAELTSAVWQRWPDHPPYEGVHDVVIPHLTVSETPIEVEVELPIRARAREVTLIETDAAGRWFRRRGFPLGER